jgi:hypothetical protein
VLIEPTAQSWARNQAWLRQGRVQFRGKQGLTLSEAITSGSA